MAKLLFILFKLRNVKVRQDVSWSAQDEISYNFMSEVRTDYTIPCPSSCFPEDSLIDSL